MGGKAGIIASKTSGGVRCNNVPAKLQKKIAGGQAKNLTLS